MSFIKPSNEAERLTALRAYNILDSAPEQIYDDIVRLAAYICHVPMATISLVDEARQWFKSRVGIRDQETARGISFCTHTILGTQPMIVGNALEDQRFAGSPLVQGDPHIRFYAGFPLINPDGFALGSLCAIDRTPRHLTADQTEAMSALSRQLMALLELRRVSAQMATALDKVKTLEGLLPICAWCKRIRESEGTWVTPEKYIMRKTDADVTHGICPDCMERQRCGEGLS